MNSKVEWVSSNQEDYSNLFRKGAEDHFERLNHYTTLNPGKAVPVDLYDNVQEGQGEMNRVDTVVVQNITPTQQALEIAKSELKDEENQGTTKKIVPVYKKKSKSGKAQSTEKFSTGKLSRKRSA